MKVYTGFDKYLKKLNGGDYSIMGSPVGYYYCDRIEFYFPYGKEYKESTRITSIPTPKFKAKYAN